MRFYLPSELKAKGFTDTEAARFSDYQHRIHGKKNASARGRSHLSQVDSQRSRTYNAEHAFRHDFGEGTAFTNINEVQVYCDRILKSATWKKISTRKSIKVSAMKRMANASTGGVSTGPTIRIAPHCFTQYMLLHEMTHSAGAMHHDVGFRQKLLVLVSRFMGRDKAKALHKSFRSYGLKMKINTNLKTPEQWIVMYRRLENARLLKAA